MRNHHLRESIVGTFSKHQTSKSKSIGEHILLIIPIGYLWGHHVTMSHGSSQIGTTYVVPYALGTFEFDEGSKCNPVRVKPLAGLVNQLNLNFTARKIQMLTPKS